MADLNRPDELVVGDDDVSIAEQLARVAVAMNELTSALAQSQPKINRIERRSFWSILMSVALVVSVVLLTISTVLSYSVVSYIRDCTDPAGACYQESRARTAGVEQRVMAAQKADSDKTLGALCALIEEHKLGRPPECPPR